jgi:uncharacterized membrane protein
MNSGIFVTAFGSAGVEFFETAAIARMLSSLFFQNRLP